MPKNALTYFEGNIPQVVVNTCDYFQKQSVLSRVFFFMQHSCETWTIFTFDIHSMYLFEELYS